MADFIATVYAVYYRKKQLDRRVGQILKIMKAINNGITKYSQ